MASKPKTRIPPPPSQPPTAWQLEKSVALWERLMSELTEDADLRPDEAEIESRIKEAGLRLPSEMLSDLIDTAIMMGHQADHAEMLRKRYADKRDRYKARVERTRNTIQQLMEALERPAHEGELGSAGMSAARKHVVVTDFSKLDEKYIRRAEPEAKKQEIAAAIKAGEIVEGAEMSTGNAPPVLQIIPY